MSLRARSWLLVGLLAAGLAVFVFYPRQTTWSSEELDTLRSLWIGSLPALRADPSNAYADDPRAAELGHALFFDPRLSANGAVSCATCHVPANAFTDRLPRGQGIGQSARRTMPLAGAGYAAWFFWDGRKDSLWSQALEPLENPVEHGFDRLSAARLIETYYREPYEAIFGPLPELSDPARFPDRAAPAADAALNSAWQNMAPADREAVNRVFANLGKSLAAYERKLVPGPARFDVYVEATLAGDEAGARALLTRDELAGLRLFIGEGGCTNCHNGPLLTNQDFHNTAVPLADEEPPDLGRAAGVQIAADDEFNCLGFFSDAGPEDCVELRFAKTSGHEIDGAFKPPSLRGVAERSPYMHNGVFTTLAEVLDHYNLAPPGPFNNHTDLQPLRMNRTELRQIETFLRTLSAPPAVEARWLSAP